MLRAPQPLVRVSLVEPVVGVLRTLAPAVVSGPSVLLIHPRIQFLLAGAKLQAIILQQVRLLPKLGKALIARVRQGLIVGAVGTLRLNLLYSLVLLRHRSVELDDVLVQGL